MYIKINVRIKNTKVNLLMCLFMVLILIRQWALSQPQNLLSSAEKSKISQNKLTVYNKTPHAKT